MSATSNYAFPRLLRLQPFRIRHFHRPLEFCTVSQILDPIFDTRPEFWAVFPLQHLAKFFRKQTGSPQTRGVRNRP